MKPPETSTPAYLRWLEMENETMNKQQAVKHFREWYADLKAMNGGKADRWAAWCEFLRVNVKEGNLPSSALDWVMP